MIIFFFSFENTSVVTVGEAETGEHFMTVRGVYTEQEDGSGHKLWHTYSTYSSTLGCKSSGATQVFKLSNPTQSANGPLWHDKSV